MKCSPGLVMRDFDPEKEDVLMVVVMDRVRLNDAETAGISGTFLLEPGFVKGDSCRLLTFKAGR